MIAANNLTPFEFAVMLVIIVVLAGYAGPP
jgi:hypothetical protein